MKLGLSSYTYGWAVGVPGSEPPRPLAEHGLLDKTIALGVGLLQVGDNLPAHTFDANRLDRLAARAARDGIELEIGARGLTSAHLQTYIALARRLSARLLRFVVDGAGYEPPPQDVIAILREALPELQDVTVGLENHDRFSVHTLRHMIDALDSPQVGICLDTANSLGAGEGLEEVVTALAPVAVNLHIKDFAVERLPHKMGFTVTGRPAGSGMVNVPRLIEQLAPYGRCRSAILELWTPPERRLEDTVAREAAWAVASVDYLKGLRLFTANPAAD